MRFKVTETTVSLKSDFVEVKQVLKEKSFSQKTHLFFRQVVWFFSKASRPVYHQFSAKDFDRLQEKIDELTATYGKNFEGLYLSSHTFHYRIWPQFKE